MNTKINSPTPAVVASLPWVRTAGGAVLNAWGVEVHPNDTVQLSTATLALTARVAELEGALADAVVSMEHDCYDLDEPPAVLVRARALLAKGGR